MNVAVATGCGGYQSYLQVYIIVRYYYVHYSCSSLSVSFSMKFLSRCTVHIRRKFTIEVSRFVFVFVL